MGQLRIRRQLIAQMADEGREDVGVAPVCRLHGIEQPGQPRDLLGRAGLAIPQDGGGQAFGGVAPGPGIGMVQPFGGLETELLALDSPNDVERGLAQFEIGRVHLRHLKGSEYTASR